MTKRQLKMKLTEMVRKALREGNTTPSNVRFHIKNGFSSLKQMMTVVENALEDDVDVESFWETYDNVLPRIEQKLAQIKQTVEKSR